MPIVESPLILSLETATRTGSVALTRGLQLLALRAGEEQTSHSTKLLQCVAEVLEESRVVLPEVELYAVASGPGSFTGLRIGLATVKSFAATLAHPCVGIPTLFAVAHAAGCSSHTLAMIPAGRGEVFAQLLSVDEAGTVTPLNQATHRSPEKLLDSVMTIRHLKLAGEAAQQYEPLIRMRTEQKEIALIKEQAAQAEVQQESEAVWSMARPTSALAINIGALADQRYRSLETIKPEELQAIYVRPSDAELNAQEP